MSYQTRLFVSNIPECTTESELRSVFSDYGKIENVDLKCKNEDDNVKKFAFITLSASSYNVESCIKHFSSELFNGSQLYVTRARESFLERLQRERDQAQKKLVSKDTNNECLPKTNPVINLSEKLNPRKRVIDIKTNYSEGNYEAKVTKSAKQKPTYDSENFNIHEKSAKNNKPNYDSQNYNTHEKSTVTQIDEKKRISDTKRLESMKKKRNEFREKQKIIKTGLVGIDKVQNKKIIFSDSDQKTTEQPESNKATKKEKQSVLFEDNDSDEEVNFKIKEQFEGKKGQKVLDLQSRYKSDRRFTLDERFIDEESDEENNNEKSEIEDVEIAPEEEKTKQLNILQDVLGVQIKTSTGTPKDLKKNKPKLGMLRFDPNHPDHAKFIVPVEEKQELLKKSKKKKSKEVNEEPKDKQHEPEVQKVEVSKEQFYKVSDSLKEAIAKPTTFSLRSLFSKNDEENNEKEDKEQDTGYVPLELPKETKVKNPFDPGQKNPFRYDSSDSDDEDNVKQTSDVLPENSQPKAVWKENLFFTKLDDRLKEGLKFFNTYKSDSQKERRELKSLMKKRIHNSERKNQMFKKKIGGRKKTMKKRFRPKH